MSEGRKPAGQPWDRDELISAFLDGSCTEAERRLVEQLLDSDQEFLDDFLSLQATRELMVSYRDALPGVPARLTARLMDQIAREADALFWSELEQIQAYVDGELSAELHLAIEERLARDHLFAEEVRQYATLRALLRSSSYTLADAFSEQLLARIDAELAAFSASATPVAHGTDRATGEAIGTWPARIVHRLADLLFGPRARVILAVACMVAIASVGYTLYTHRESRPMLASRAPVPSEPRVELRQNRAIPHPPVSEAMQSLVASAWNDVQEFARKVREGTAEALSTEASIAGASEPVREEANVSALMQGATLPPINHMREAMKTLGENVFGSPIGSYIGSVVSWKGDDNRIHCAVVVDLEMGRETVRILCQKYNLGEPRAAVPQAPSETTADADSGELVVLTVPRDRAAQLLADMEQQFAAIAAAQDDGAREIAATSPSPSNAPTGTRKDAPEASDTGPLAEMHVNATPDEQAVTLPLPPARVRLLREIVAEVRRFTEFRRQSAGPRRFSLPVFDVLGSAWGDRGAEKLQESAAAEPSAPPSGDNRVRVFLYLIDGKADRVPVTTKPPADNPPAPQ